MEENISMNNILFNDPKIVVIGGGTGLSILLRGLKKFTSNITAIVTVADDGGGSGVLREDLGMLPPGDIRACMLSLANVEPTMKKLLHYRFDSGVLDGQSFGNLLIAAMNGIYGNFEKAIKETSNVLAMTGEVYPMTLEEISLFAELENGKIVKGESNIPNMVVEHSSSIKRVFIDPQTSNPLKEGVQAFKDADLIVLGPGSLYTSVIPNLLINNIPKKIAESKAPKVYISNVMTQPGETDGYGVIEHVEAILRHSREDLLDYVIVNTETIPENILPKYTTDGSRPVILNNKDKKVLKKKGINIIEESLIDVRKDYIRHNNIKLSQLLVDLCNIKR
ncbi:MAG TPA: YvcK family protein [Tissierellaceae bacterium]|nr:YvcK family protein [Tissierellaceae bacterium]